MHPVHRLGLIHRYVEGYPVTTQTVEHCYPKEVLMDTPTLPGLQTTGCWRCTLNQGLDGYMPVLRFNALSASTWFNALLC
jgi:hypothetical protein